MSTSTQNAMSRPRIPGAKRAAVIGALLRGATAVFAEGRPVEPPADVKTLHAKIRELTLENDFLERALTKAGGLSAQR